MSLFFPTTFIISPFFLSRPQDLVAQAQSEVLDGIEHWPVYGEEKYRIQLVLEAPPGLKPIYFRPKQKQQQQRETGH